MSVLHPFVVQLALVGLKEPARHCDLLRRAPFFRGQNVPSGTFFFRSLRLRAPDPAAPPPSTNLRNTFSIPRFVSVVGFGSRRTGLRLATAAPALLGLWLAVSSSVTGGCGSASEAVPPAPAPTEDESPAPTPLPLEECNGLDDNGDGTVDELFDDADGDGTADCVDPGCSAPPSPTTVVLNQACTHLAPGIAETYEVVVEQMLVEPNPPADCGGGFSGLTVLQTNDDNGDGVVDGADALDIVAGGDCWGASASSLSHGLIFHPSSGGVTVLPPGSFFAGPVPDVTGDGEPEFAGYSITQANASVTRSYRLFTRSGDLVWESNLPAEFAPDAGLRAPLATQVGASGDIGMIWFRRLLDGRTGAPLATLPLDAAPLGSWVSAVVDLDLDGTAEILTLDGLFDLTGQRLWSVPEPSEWNQTLVVQADSDPQGEVVALSGSDLWILDEAGAVLDWSALDDAEAGPPCLADIDGDGQPELFGHVTPPIGWEAVRALRLDGTELWRHTSHAETVLTACAAFDFEGDGRFELVHTDREGLKIRDGLTGDVLFELEAHVPIGDPQAPIAADIDGDGSAEILFATWPTETLTGGLAILGSPRSLWMPGADAWPSRDFRVDNVEVNAAVPPTPAATWQTHNSVLAAPQRSRPHPNLRPVVTGFCVSGCLDENELRLSFAVANDGLVDVPAGVPIALRHEEKPELPHLWSGQTAQVIPPGGTSESFEYVMVRDDLQGGLEISVDPSDGFGVVAECIENDNRLVWFDPCP